MQKKINKTFKQFLKKPTKENIEMLMQAAEQYNSDWIENAAGSKPEPKTKAIQKLAYERIMPSKEDLDSRRKSGKVGPYILLQKRINVEDPFHVISFRDYNRNIDNPSGRTTNRRWYFIKQSGYDQPRAWFFYELLDLFLDKVHQGALEDPYDDHRRPKNIELHNQFVHSADMSKDEKVAYLKDMVFSEDEIYDDFMSFNTDPPTFFDIVDELEFCIDLYAGDAINGDPSSWRKVMFKYNELYTVRSLTTANNYRPVKNIVYPNGRISDWKIDVAMPDISVQAMRKFWDTLL